MHVHTRESVVADHTADVVKVHVDAVGGRASQGAPDVSLLVVDGGVKVELVLEVGTLFFTAGYS